jgi:Tol biopolymer transport system component
MALAPGTRLGAYEIVSALGVGGMGEVYRATDTRLKRSVAIKVLPASFSDDPERLSRFQREAELLAAMNHPHIATVYGLEQVNGIQALVMELVEGEDLARRIARGRVPLAEAVIIARQIADALEAAHGRQVIHRDLKPANVQLRPDGTVKVLDFGLAKTIDAGADMSPAGPTVTAAGLTEPGAMLGTVAYMSPEQIEGRPATRRSDIWAFGCVVFEMLTGVGPFAGRTTGEVLANVLRNEPDWQRLPADTPDRILRLLRRALAKDDRQRWHDIADARLELDDARGDGPAGTHVHHAPISRRERLAWLAAVVALAALAGAAMLRPTPGMAPAKLVVDLTTAPVVDPQDLASFALSPDGTQVVATGVVDGRSQLVVRGLGSATPRPVPGTVGGMFPFWSPDGRSLGFFVDGYLRRLDVDAGLIRPLAKATVGVGGSWNADGAILFAPTPASPIFRTSSDGAPPAVVTALAAGHAGHAFPHFLPDGRRFLYFVVGSPEARGVYVGQLDGTAATRLFDADAPAIYTAGQLIFVRNRTLYAQPFDPAQLALRGSPFALADGVMGNTGYYVTVSAGSGTVAFRAGSGRRQRQFVRVDRTGREIERLGEPDDAHPVGPTPSPDGGRVAVFRRGATDSDVWLFDTRRGVLSRFTTTAGEDIFPAWSRDGSRIAFTSTRSLQGVGIYTRSTAGGDSDTLLVPPSPEETFPADWSPDGRTLVFQRRTEKTGWDLWALPLSGGNPSPLIQTDADERNAQISPDGKWIAYVANTSGREEVYVQPFPAGGTAMQVSVNGGAQVRWRPDGRELFYLTLESRLLVAVAVGLGGDGGLVLGAGTQLFAMNVGHVLNAGPTPEYVPSADGQRFLINVVLEDPRPTPLRLVMHWVPGP